MARKNTILEKLSKDKNCKFIVYAYSREYHLYMVKSGAFIQAADDNSESIGAANGIGLGSTCLGGFVSHLNDKEREYFIRVFRDNPKLISDSCK